MRRSTNSHVLLLPSLLAYMINILMVGYTRCDSETTQARPSGQELVRNMMTFYGNMERFNVVVSKTTFYSEGDRSTSISGSYTISLDKPNRLAIEVTDGLLLPTIRSDGAKVMFYHPLVPERFVSWSNDKPLVFAPIPLTMGQWHFWPTLRTIGDGVNDPLAILLKTRPSSIRIVGDEKVGKRDTFHLVLPWGLNEVNFKNEIHIWIQKGKEPWVEKVRMSEEFFGGTEQRNAEYIEYFTDWTTEPMPQSKFAATPPVGRKSTEPMVFVEFWRMARRSYFVKLFESLR